MRLKTIAATLLVAGGCYQGGGAEGGTDTTPQETGQGPGGDDVGETEEATAGDETDTSPGDPTEGSPPAACEPARSPMRRLTRTELRNSFRDLFPTITLPALDLAVDKPKDNFDNNVDTQEPTDVYVESYYKATAAVGQTVMADLAGVMGCDLGSDGAQQTCADAYVPDLLRRAFRRPPTPAEVDKYMSFLAAQWGEHGFPDAMRLLVMAVLHSPSFQYRPEFGLEGADPAQALPLRGHELAVRLSYFLWQTMPDEELFTAADSGVLDTPAGLEEQARRMLADDRARAAVADFHRQWLALDTFGEISRDPGLFPLFNDQVAPAMEESLRRYVEHVFWDTDATLATLLLEPITYANATLAPIYGVDAPSPEMQLVDLDADQRAGLLTQPALMASMAHEKFDAPILRGIYVLDRFICEPPGAPPPNVPDIPPAQPNEGPKTTRQRIEETHDADPFCQSCHVSIDAVGFAFNHYDAIGAWRTTENGLPIDATGVLKNLAGFTDASFDGALEFSTLLLDNPQVERCVARQNFRYALGRHEGLSDACALDDVLAAANGDLREMMIQLVLTDNFRQRAAIEGE